MPSFLLPFSLFLITLLSSACVRVNPPALAPVSGGACRSATAQWFAPADADQRDRLDSWCAGVGAVAIQPPAGTAPARAVGLEEITFVSWNVHVGRGDIRAFVRDLRAGHHTDGRTVDEYVLMLQEAVRTDGVPAFPGGAASGANRIAAHDPGRSIDIVQIARELGLSLIYIPSMRNGKSADDPREDRGNAILSTLPLTDPVAVELPGERQRRVVIVARTAAVSVGTVHLDALGGGKRLWLFWTPWMRDGQIRSLASQLPDGPLVIGGDLNTWHGRHELAARFLKGLTRETGVTASRHGLGLRVLDYLFFRVGPTRRAQYRHLANRYGSDHRPLVGWVE